MIKTFRYVRHHEVEAYQRSGWHRHDSLDGTHHGEWSALMEFMGDSVMANYATTPESLARADLNDELAGV